ncbi:OST-HTH/LOTUS domain-containing protein [Ruegeria aquimaris]|uniref:OST-HTH/LOTUS domain-containing protein n=1 Tax=Ruegeria aquimaris TaxID=2984333 RepID=A0ABT3APR1_9RHOB|nr:OST-HTH/LOTUS domain-containing protein [Ruegeria sp. XHP0148]MCV2890674.1 OST-HTH/LOTUS domain-containing protein [Ruegeria sp. XHP0148]
MTAATDDMLRAEQHEIQRLLGRCLLTFQNYERLLKGIMAHYEFSGSAETLQAVREARITETARKTLGALVGEMLGSCIVSDATAEQRQMADDITDEEAPCSMRMYIGIPDAEFGQLVCDLKDLVSMRNTLVHNFIEQHDLGTLEGCPSARDALIQAQDWIDHHLEQLRAWTDDLLRAKQQMSEYLQSDAIRNLIVNGILPDGTVYWPFAGIVDALNEAADTLAVDGWVPVKDAGEWIAERYPDQAPKRYGCRGWRQVLHEARVFELRYFETDGPRSAKYRKLRSH